MTNTIKRLIIAGMLLVVVFVTTTFCQERRTVKVTVTEGDGTFLQGVTVTVTFLGAHANQTKRKKGVTDAQGVFEARGSAKLRMHVRLEKEGYYETRSGRLSRKKDHEVTFVLRQKKNPISLYARRVRLNFPKNSEWLDFDFQAGDWVSPLGKGKVSDAQFKCGTKKTGEMDGEGILEIKFREGEGMILEKRLENSEMKMPHFAPRKGYVSRFIRKEDSYHNKNYIRGAGYFFRVRIKRENGKIISANYGKLLSDISYYPLESGWHVSHKGKPKSYGAVSFTTYYNPTPNDRNLEFDPKQNLFKKLNSVERVNDP